MFFLKSLIQKTDLLFQMRITDRMDQTWDLRITDHHSRFPNVTGRSNIPANHIFGITKHLTSSLAALFISREKRRKRRKKRTKLMVVRVKFMGNKWIFIIQRKNSAHGETKSATHFFISLNHSQELETWITYIFIKSP